MRARPRKDWGRAPPGGQTIDPLKKIPSLSLQAAKFENLAFDGRWHWQQFKKKEAEDLLRL